MLPLEVFVLELLSVDGLSACAITSSEIATLQHETLDDTMKDRSCRALWNSVVTRKDMIVMANLCMSKVSLICLHPSRQYTAHENSLLFLGQLWHRKMRNELIDTSTFFLTIVVLPIVSTGARTMIPPEAAVREFYGAFDVPVRM